MTTVNTLGYTNEEEVQAFINQVVEERQEAEAQALELLAKVEELEAKLKSQAGKQGARVKEATQEYKEQLQEKDNNIDRLTKVIEKQEELIQSQQNAILELTERCESAYEVHNELVRKLDAVQLILGK